MFGVTYGNFLGYIILRRGIEVDPAKIKAITNMPPPRNTKEIRSLSEKINAICKFITQLSDKCKPFNHILNKEIKFEWKEECQEDFDQIKKYILSPPILIPPNPSKPFHLYISTIDIAIGTMLAQNNGMNKEHAIY